MAEYVPSFKGPVPGQSLTSNIKNNLWQRPPQYATVQEAIDYYLDMMVNGDTLRDFADVMEAGVPLTAIANSLQLGSVMKGKHTIDVGIMCLPVIIEVLIIIAERAGVDYFIGTEEEKMTPQLSSARMSKIKMEIKKEMREATRNLFGEDEDMAMPDESEMMPEQQAAQEPMSGLMARRA